MSDPTRRLAIVGDSAAAPLRDAATAAGVRLADPDRADAVVAVGDDALRDAVVAAATGGNSAPVLPVDAGRHGTDAELAADRLSGLLSALGDGSGTTAGFERVAHPVLAVESPAGDRRLAAADVAFVTAEPARISEYGITLSDGETASFRADGVVVATPLGSGGYASAAGGPVVSPGGGLAVVPVAPFTTRPETRVATGPVEVTVEREEVPVACVVDGDRVGTVEPYRAVSVEVAATVDLLAPRDE